MKNLLFAALDIKGKRCTIIGGGKVAERKAKKLVICGADVYIVSPSFTEGLESMADEGKISLVKRRYEKSDLAKAFLVIISTDDNGVNLEVLKDAKELGILTNAAFDKALGDIFFTATKDAGGFIISAMSKDSSPGESLDILDDICGKLKDA